MKVLGGNGLKKTLYNLREYPQMFILEERAENLFQFLIGWNLHRLYSPDEDIFADIFFLNFDHFVIFKLNMRPTSQGWAVTISNLNDGRTEIEAFFDLLIEFEKSEFFTDIPIRNARRRMTLDNEAD